MRKRVSMPRWPAWILFGAAAACAYPAVTTPAPGPLQESYEARGQEPGWHLRIHEGRIDYTGNYGEVRITQLRPEPRPTASGRRYETERLTVDITHTRCNDSMSGHGYEHRVSVTADGQTFGGCGGERRRDWDAYAGRGDLTKRILAAALLTALAACADAQPPVSAHRFDIPEPPDPRRLVGTNWRLIEADGVRIDRAAGYNPAILRIGADRLTGHGGCNAFGARYRTIGFAFVVDELESTQIGCPDPVGPLEERLFRVLAAPFEWGTSKPDGRFTIIGGRERAVFVFEPIRD